MLTKVLILVALGFVALGALRFAAAAPRPRWVMPAIIGVAVAALLWRYGIVGIGAGALAGALSWGVLQLRTPRSGPAIGLSEAEAQALLGLGPTATEEDIRAAHRRRITEAHPDRGGDALLAARLNAARDLLLKARKKV